MRFHRLYAAFWLPTILFCLSGCAHELGVWSEVLCEQRTIDTRDISALPKAQIPDIPQPETVSRELPKDADRPLSLDEAIEIGLANSKVVRVLAGTTAVSSGRTIYDAAITNTTIDQQRARFDPTVEVNNNFDRVETPAAVLDFMEPAGARIDGLQTNRYNLAAGVSKTMPAGGTASVTITDDVSRFNPGIFPLNPQSRSAATIRFDQPLLQGAGRGANLSPIVIARINTERSFFQFKDAMQQSMRGVIEAYWAVVFARTDVWAREQQVEQGKFAFDRALGRQKAGIGNLGEVVQSRAALENFKATLVAARANQIQREAALRNILGLPPADGTRLVPISPPTDDQIQFQWEELLRLAEQRRPDLIELKLIIEADQQLLLQTNNRALPQVDAVALYRWNGLDGTTPRGNNLSTRGGQFTDWTIGVNFSVPVGLRGPRAALRQQKLILARDYANLDQGMHAAVHDLAASVRFLAQFYQQYLAFKQARKAARENLDFQLAIWKVGGRKDQPAFFLNVLQAISDWGNSVSAEAQALAQYNTELANLETQTGTILETHGVFFFEERFAAIGPLGRIAHPRWYPSSTPPGPNTVRYPEMSRPAENFFDLSDPIQLKFKK